MQTPVGNGDLDFGDLNREQLRLHLLGAEHALGVHRFSVPCPPECPLEEITHTEARNRAALLLRRKTPSGPWGHWHRRPFTVTTDDAIAWLDRAALLIDGGVPI